MTKHKRILALVVVAAVALGVAAVVKASMVNLICEDFNGSDHVEGVLMTALKIGTAH